MNGKNQNASVIDVTSVESLIVVQQLPVIKEQLYQIKEKVSEVVNDALSLDVNENTLSDVKKKRAELNKMASAFEDKRKEVKKSVLTPYEDFEKVYKECVIDTFRSADSELKGKIDNVENVIKAEKQKDIEAYFAELCAANGIDFVRFEQLGIRVTLSDSTKKIKAAVKDRIEKISEDVAMIRNFDNADEVMAEYKTTLDSTTAISTVSARHRAIEAERQRAEKRRQAESDLSEAANRVQDIYNAQKPVFSEPLAPPVVKEPDAQNEEIYSATFTVRGTIDELKAVKNFMIDRGIKYEC